MTSMIAAFIARRWGLHGEHCRVDVQPVHGGLESTVARARISWSRPVHALPAGFVIKELPEGGEREADVYDLLWRHVGEPPAARVLGRDTSARRTYLYLEDVASSVAWPWSDPSMAGAVCRALARLHDVSCLPSAVFEWDYEAELRRSAESTLRLACEARDASGRRVWARQGELRRVVAALPDIRRALFAATRTVVIHGDVHPGNVIVRPADPEPQVVFLDWGRARLGSPMEDVASWLQSLGCWEPEARRRHDRLMHAYLAASGRAQAFTPDLRREYWLASASNALSGAIRYHLWVLSNPGSDEGARADSRRALGAWERVIRRTAALLSTSPDR